MLLKARTGSGKTGAFVIPVIQKILEKKQVRAMFLLFKFVFNSKYHFSLSLLVCGSLFPKVLNIKNLSHQAISYVYLISVGLSVKSLLNLERLKAFSRSCM